MVFLKMVVANQTYTSFLVSEVSISAPTICILHVEPNIIFT